MRKEQMILIGMVLLIGQVALGQNFSLDFQSGNYARIPMSESLSGFDTFTMECWYYQIAFDGGDERVVGLEPANSVTGSYQINVSGGGVGAYSASIGDGASWLSCVHVQAVNPNSWTHLAISYDGMTFRFFIDGALIYYEDGDIGAFGPPDQDLVINRHTWDGGSSWSSRLTGHLDDLRISDVARYTEEFAPPLCQFTPDEYTMGLWHFDEGSGSTVFDSSLNGNDGSVNGASWCEEVPCTFTEIDAPKLFSLDRSYPNPFNPSMTVEFSLAMPSEVLLTIYNTNGHLVEVIQDGLVPAGHHTATWSPSELPSGVYLVELFAGGIRDVMKVSYLK
jgi:hypothetical protein